MLIALIITVINVSIYNAVIARLAIFLSPLLSLLALFVVVGCLLCRPSEWEVSEAKEER